MKMNKAVALLVVIAACMAGQQCSFNCLCRASQISDAVATLNFRRCFTMPAYAMMCPLSLSLSCLCLHVAVVNASGETCYYNGWLGVCGRPSDCHATLRYNLCPGGNDNVRPQDLTHHMM